jgi:hypothetical protein
MQVIAEEEEGAGEGDSNGGEGEGDGDSNGGEGEERRVMSNGW